jgi:aspartate-semialdehyde dehydrogenase
MSKKYSVGVLGATGMVGQQFVNFLEGHPWFELTWVGASDKSSGKPYREATTWRLEGSMPERVAEMMVEECKPGNAPKLVFSAVEAHAATQIESDFAAAGHVVVSNSRNHRMERDVPLLVPEINPDHLKLLPFQAARGWKGVIATNPNCSTVALTMGLAPLKHFGIEKVIVTTMQAVSGAGYPGVPSMDILANVIPYIGGEEEKMQRETQKILGTFKGDHVEPLKAVVSAQCNRVATIDGHLVTISVSLHAKPSLAEVRAAFENFTAEPQRRKLPSAPHPAVLYMEAPDRPQPRRDAGRWRGMQVTVGRLRECPVLDYKFISLGHNTIRGAAGAAVLNAELMQSEGLLD